MGLRYRVIAVSPDENSPEGLFDLLFNEEQRTVTFTRHSRDTLYIHI